jgi:hypothetical protein
MGGGGTARANARRPAQPDQLDELRRSRKYANGALCHWRTATSLVLVRLLAVAQPDVKLRRAREGQLDHH